MSFQKSQCSGLREYSPGNYFLKALQVTPMYSQGWEIRLQTLKQFNPVQSDLGPWKYIGCYPVSEPQTRSTFHPQCLFEAIKISIHTTCLVVAAPGSLWDLHVVPACDKYWPLFRCCCFRGTGARWDTWWGMFTPSSNYLSPITDYLKLSGLITTIPLYLWV